MFQYTEDKNISSQCVRVRQCVEDGVITLPAWFTGRLDADLDQNIFRGSVFSAVIRSHGELVHAFFAIAQLLCVFDEA